VFRNYERLDPDWKPRIAYYYRGYYAFQDTPIFNEMVDLLVTVKSGADPLQVNMRPPDNDYRDAWDAAKFAAAIEVKAVFSALNDETGLRKTTSALSYDDETIRTTAGGGSRLQPWYYSMDFGVPKWKIAGTPIAVGTFWGLCSNDRYNGEVQPVTVAYYSVSGTGDADTTRGSLETREVNVSWTGIPLN